MTVQDDLCAELRELATASHPSIYDLEPWTIPGRERMPGLRVAEDHPAHERFDALAHEAEPFAQLYDAGPHGAFVSASIGHGWRMQPGSLAPAIVATAARDLLFRATATDPEALAQRSCEVLDQVVRLLSSEAVEVPAFMAFSGIALEPGVEVELPWGRPRNASEFEKSIHPFGDRRPSLIVESRVRATLQIGEPDETSNFDPEALQRSARSAALLPLAAVLGIQGDSYSYVSCPHRL